MINRINATEARQKAQIAARQAEEIQARADANKKIVTDLRNAQCKSIIVAAVDGKTTAKFLHNLALGSELEQAGFSIFEINVNVQDNDLQDLAKIDRLLVNILEINIADFIFNSKQNFNNEKEYEFWMRKKINSFLDRAKRLHDTANNFALIHFLNSESYDIFSRDGSWNNYTNQLVAINKIIHAMAVGQNISSENSDMRRKQIIFLLPYTAIPCVKINSELLKTENQNNYFSVTWERPASSKKNANSLLTANRMAWLAGLKGQKLMNFIFNKIQNVVTLGEQSVKLACRFDRSKWTIENQTEIEEVTIDQLGEILAAKGYEMKKIKGAQSSLNIIW